MSYLLGIYTVISIVLNIIYIYTGILNTEPYYWGIQLSLIKFHA